MRPGGLVSERVTPNVGQPGQIPLLVGCDCSVVLGATQALKRVAGDEVHVLYVDGDFDDDNPDTSHCKSAAALRPSQVTVIGWSNASQSTDVRRLGAEEAARQALASVPGTAAIVSHRYRCVQREEPASPVLSAPRRDEPSGGAKSCWACC